MLAFYLKYGHEILFLICSEEDDSYAQLNRPQTCYFLWSLVEASEGLEELENKFICQLATEECEARTQSFVPQAAPFKRMLLRGLMFCTTGHSLENNNLLFLSNASSEGGGCLQMRPHKEYN